MPSPFLRLDQLLLPPPLAALSGLAQACGIVGLGIAAARRLRGSKFEPLDGAAGIVLVAALLAAGLHGVALAGLLRLWPLRILAGLLAAIGAATAFRYGPVLVLRFRILRDRWRQWPSLDRLLAVLLGLTAAGLFLAALGPACDADSVAYHLAVPLDWLRHGGAEPRTDWHYARLVGIGEMLDLLGLAGGSDSLGAMLQWTGAILAAVAVATFAHRERDRLLAVALVLASPVLMSLVPAQKPQVFPAAGTAVALVLLVRRWKDLDRSTLALAFACAAFAMACKYSFLFSGSVVVIVGLWAALDAGGRTRPAYALASASAALLLIAAPVYLRNLAFYGDPVSPFLERWRAVPNASVVDLANYLGSYGGPRNLSGAVHLFSVLVWRPISGALGLGVLVPLLGGWEKSSARRLLAAAGAAVALDLAFGQLTPRFFLEPFYWSLAAIGLRQRPLGTAFAALLSAQAAVTATGAAIFAFLLFPGSWSSDGRERVLRAHAPGYAESRWLDEVLRPSDALLSQISWGLFLPRPFVMADSFDGSRPQELEGQELRGLQLDAGLSVLAFEPDDGLSPALADAARQGQALDGPHTFPPGTRNPLLHTPDVELRAFRLK